MKAYCSERYTRILRHMMSVETGSAYPWNTTPIITMSDITPLRPNLRHIQSQTERINTTYEHVHGVPASTVTTEFFLKQPRLLTYMRRPTLICSTWFQPRPWVLPADCLHWTTMYHILDQTDPADCMTIERLHADSKYPFASRLEAWAAIYPLPLRWIPYKHPPTIAQHTVYIPWAERPTLDSIQIGRDSPIAPKS
jgi:hypothetical protein